MKKTTFQKMKNALSPSNAFGQNRWWTSATLSTALSLAAISPVWAGNLTTDAAVGGAIGGALGGAIGAEVGGRDGAVLGAGVGAAAGAALNTKGDDKPRRTETVHREYEEVHYYEDDHRGSRHHHDDHHGRSNFCPPGQAKKGRC